MNFTCDNCQRRYSIADEKVRGKTVKVRCRNCNNLCTVQGPPAEAEERTSMMSLEQVEKLRAQGARPNPSAGVGAVALAAEAPASASGKTPWDDEATVAAPPLSGKAEWFAMVKGKQVGPFDPRGVAELVRVGDVTLKSYLWRKGMAEWKRGSDVPELAPVFAGASGAPGPTVAAPVPAPKPAAPPKPAASSSAPAPAAQPESTRPTGVRPGVQAAASQPQPQSQKAGASSLDELPFDMPSNSQPPTASQVGKLMNLGELFSDADLPNKEQAGSAESDIADEPTRAPIAQKVNAGKSKGAKPVDDPFAALGDIDPASLPPPGEATRFFIAQAGVNKRNPWYKTVGFILGGLALVGGVLFGLASMNVVPLKVKTTNADGQVVEQSVFSGEGVSALGDILLGRGKKPAATPPPTEDKKPQHHAVASGDPKSGANMPKVDATPQTHVPTQEELAALYGDSSKTDKGPHIRAGTEEKAKDTSSGALSEEQIAKVVAQSQSAFQNCIEQELRKNPSMKVPRFYIVATVAASGVVKSASIDRKEVDMSPLGECLKTRAKRMTFAQFSGDDVDVEIPLIVGTSM